MLYREPKLLKAGAGKTVLAQLLIVSVLYREPKLLKVEALRQFGQAVQRFSALP